MKDETKRRWRQKHSGEEELLRNCAYIKIFVALNNFEYLLVFMQESKSNTTPFHLNVAALTPFSSHLSHLHFTTTSVSHYTHSIILFHSHHTHTTISLYSHFAHSTCKLHAHLSFISVSLSTRCQYVIDISMFYITLFSSSFIILYQ